MGLIDNIKSLFSIGKTEEFAIGLNISKCVDKDTVYDDLSAKEILALVPQNSGRMELYDYYSTFYGFYIFFRRNI